MDNKLKYFLNLLEERKRLNVTEDYLLSVFEKDFNPEKRQTKYTELKRWMEWASVQFNFRYRLDQTEVIPTYYFEKL